MHAWTASEWILAVQLALWPLVTCSYLLHPLPVGFLAEVLTGIYIALWLRVRYRARKEGKDAV